MNIFSWLKSFLPKKSPLTLYKEKEENKWLEAIRRSVIETTPRGGMRRIGMSEYGARKHLEEGITPDLQDRVLTEDGDLVSWHEWLVLNKIDKQA